jgi:hypothetical protein
MTTSEEKTEKVNVQKQRKRAKREGESKFFENLLEKVKIF